MEITMSKKAVETLIDKVGKNTKIALALINDSDPSLRDKGACAKGSFFQIIPFVTDFGDYVTKINHPFLEIYTSKLEQSYLGRHLNMDFNKQLESFFLENEITVLDRNIKLKNCFFS
ncbi:MULTISPECIES: iron-sulfur cluster biosynthesis family protein [unclassified Enterococcus]|uniref:iron-sulfur cluster biosynthesis family protein n=1 Tax=unclassified Enterococcus TaxID=2608891 RepID=UPI0013EB26D9|nr:MULTISPECIES: iron-sulfur cluster biosynthesis family protein [unclassified Enterococcus]